MDPNHRTASPQTPAPVTWDAVKDAELDDALRATPAQRLAWLEEAMRIAWEAGARPERRGG